MNLRDLANKNKKRKEGLAALANAPEPQISETVRPPASKKGKLVRVIVDEEWISHLTELANNRYGETEQFGHATISFTITRSKGKPVCMTPKLSYPDGTIRSAGDKHRVGFFGNKKFEQWYEKLEKSLSFAHSVKRQRIRRSSSAWKPYIEKLKELGAIKLSAGKLSIQNEQSKVVLKHEKDTIVVSSAKGDTKFIIKILSSLEIT